MKATKRSAPAKAAAKTAQKAAGFTDDELSAMRERAKELKRSAAKNEDNGEAEALAKIAEMEPDDRAKGERIHQIVKTYAPSLAPRTWYGMPAYARDGDVVCFFQSARKFKTRYATLGFSHKAKLDDGHMWPTAFALVKLTPAEETRIIALVKKAAG